jgi:hypothetical protein
MDDPSPVRNSAHSVCADLLRSWVGGRGAPEGGVEGASPALAAALSTSPADLTFDAFFHSAREPGWGWQQLTFPEFSEGPFLLYVPEGWQPVQHAPGSGGVRDENGEVRQTIFLMPIEGWGRGLEGFLEKNEVVGFAFHPLFEHFLQWVLVTAGETTHWVWGAYSAGDWLVLIKADAPDPESLRQQLVSLVNTCPWYGWIDAAQASE